MNPQACALECLIIMINLSNYQTSKFNKNKALAIAASIGYD